MAPQDLLDRASEIQAVFDERLSPEGKRPPPNALHEFELTESAREVLFQLLQFLGNEGKAGFKRIRAIQDALGRMDHQNSAQKEMLAWSCEQWWIEADKVERGRLMKMLHDGTKAPTPKERQRRPEGAHLKFAGKTASRPGGLAGSEPK